MRAWNRHAERWLAADWTSTRTLGTAWYAGRPLLVTSNDYALDVYNGETGVVVRTPRGRRGRGSRARGSRGPPGAPGRGETMHAMTIHKSQGSQAREVAVLAARRGLPPADARAVHGGHPRRGGSWWAHASRRTGGSGQTAQRANRPCASGSPAPEDQPVGPQQRETHAG